MPPGAETPADVGGVHPMTTTQPTDGESTDTDRTTLVWTRRSVADVDATARTPHASVSPAVDDGQVVVRDYGDGAATLSFDAGEPRAGHYASTALKLDPEIARELGTDLRDAARSALDDDPDVSRDDLGSSRINVSDRVRAHAYDRGDPDTVVLSSIAGADTPTGATLTVDEARELRDDLDAALAAIASERAHYDSGD